jgi:uncharacterized protein (TIRG00374 family)
MSFAILAYLFNKASKDDQFAAVLSGDKDWRWLMLGFLACLAAHVIGFLRWRVMVRALDLPFRYLDAVRIGFIGLFFNLFAFGVLGGDALRAYYVTREFPSRKPEAIASVVADRMIGLLTMFLVASIAFLLSDFAHMESTHPKKLASIRYVCTLVVSVTTVGFAGLAILFFMPRFIDTKWVRRLLKLPRVGEILKRIVGVTMVYRNRPLAVLISFLMSAGVNIAFAISIYSIAAGLFSDYPSFVNHFVIEPITMVSNALPLPGGIGGMELALDFLYQAFACEHGVVVAFAFRFALLLVSAIGAFVWFFNRSNVKNLIRATGESAAA